MTAVFDEKAVRACELHEAQAWREWVEGCVAADGNLLRAEVASASRTPVPKRDRLGIAAPATDGQLDEIAALGATRGQSNWAVSLSPLAEPDDLAARLEQRGMGRGADFAKVTSAGMERRECRRRGREGY